jgi:hypothetical protein
MEKEDFDLDKVIDALSAKEGLDDADIHTTTRRLLPQERKILTSLSCLAVVLIVGVIALFRIPAISSENSGGNDNIVMTQSPRGHCITPGRLSSATTASGASSPLQEAAHVTTPATLPTHCQHLLNPSTATTQDEQTGHDTDTITDEMNYCNRDVCNDNFVIALIDNIISAASNTRQS